MGRLEHHLDAMLTIADDSAFTNATLDAAWVEHKDAAELLDGDVKKAYYSRVRDGVAVADLDDDTAKRYQNARQMWSRCIKGRSDTNAAEPEIQKAGEVVLNNTKKEHGSNTTKVLRDALRQSVEADKAAKAAKKA